MGRKSKQVCALRELTVWSEWIRVETGKWRSVSALDGKVCSAVGACEVHTTWISGISEGFFLERVISML